MELSPIAREEGIWLFEGLLLFHQLLLNPVFENPLHMNTLLQKELHCNKTSEESSWTELTEAYARKVISPKAHKEWNPGKMAESDPTLRWFGMQKEILRLSLIGYLESRGIEESYRGRGAFLRIRYRTGSEMRSFLKPMPSELNSIEGNIGHSQPT